MWKQWWLVVILWVLACHAMAEKNTIVIKKHDAQGNVVHENVYEVEEPEIQLPSAEFKQEGGLLSAIFGNPEPDPPKSEGLVGTFLNGRGFMALLASGFFAMVGVAYMRVAKAKGEPLVMITGVVLIFYSYFIPNPIGIALVGVLICLFPWAWNRYLNR